MKKILQSILVIVCVSLTSHAQELQKNYINYQGVANDATGNAIVNSNVAIQIALRFGNVTAAPAYIENHTITTDANGVFSLQIGNGTLVSGMYDSADWGTDASYITVSLNGTEVGTTEMIAVPYAISSGDTQWRLDGTNIESKNTGDVIVSNNLEVTGTLNMSTGATIDEFSSDGALADDSDTALPTEKAVKAYVDNATSDAVATIDDLFDAKTNVTSIFLGEGAGFTETSIDRWNVGVGLQSLFLNTTGSNNTANGYQTLYFNTTGSDNTALGTQSLYFNTAGSDNTALGTQSLYSNTTGSFNTASGNTALYSNTTGIANSSLGDQSLYSNTTGDFNTALGASSLLSNTSGSFNTAVGNNAMFSNTTGGSNVALGDNSLFFNTTGDTNTAVGSQALYSNSGSGNVALGFGAGASEIGSNKLYIDNSNTENPLIYGEFDNNVLIFNGTTIAKNPVDTSADLVLSGTGNTPTGDDGIITSDLNYPGSDIFLRSNDNIALFIDGANDPLQNGDFEIYNGAGQLLFNVNEDGNANLAGSLTQNSDRRLKKDIENLPYGLKEVLQLQPKIYNWKDRTQPNKSLGLIAQDVKNIIIEVVTVQADEAKTLGISYNELIPVLINAIKEQQVQIDSLKEQIKNK